MSLIAHWKLDEQTGTSIADSAGTNTGTWAGTGGQGITSVPAPNGTGLLFDGSGDAITVPDSASLDVTAVTISTWVNIDVGHVGSCYLVAKMQTLGSQEAYRVLIESDGRIAFMVSDDGAPKTAEDSVGVLSYGVWHHVAATYSLGTYIIYVNGVAVPSDGNGASTGTINVGTGRFDIGARPAGTGVESVFFDGSIDDVRIYDTALTASEILALYNSSNGLLSPFNYITHLK